MRRIRLMRSSCVPRAVASVLWRMDSEYGLVKEVCRKSCGVCTTQYLSISIDNNNDNNNNNHKDDVVGEEEVKLTKQVVDTGVLLSPLVPPVVVVVVQLLSDLEKQQLKSG